MTPGGPAAGRLRICLARREDHFHAVARVWAEALLLPGLTELPPVPTGEDGLRRLTEQVAQRLQHSYDRKLKAAAESRVLRRRGAALLQQLRQRGGGGGVYGSGGGGMTVLEYQMATRQLEAVRRELRRARRRRLWACLVAWREVPPCDGRVGDEGGSAGGGREAGVGGAGVEGQDSGEAGESPRRVEPGQRRPRHRCGGETGRCGGSGPGPRTEQRGAAPAAAVGASATHSSRGAGGASGGTAVQARAGDTISDSAWRDDDDDAATGGGSGGGSGGDGSCRWSVAGYVLVSLSQPLALLPPPLPSRAPPQIHVDALAVAPGHRRRGVGSALLAAAERLAARWGGSSLWLHVDSSNDAAVQMYSDCGYGIARIDTPSPVARLAAALTAAPAGGSGTGGWRPAVPLALWLRGQGRPHEGPARQTPLPTPSQQQQPRDPNVRVNKEGGPGHSLRDVGWRLEERELEGALEVWRRRQRSRKFVMQKRLTPHSHQKKGLQTQQPRRPRFPRQQPEVQEPPPPHAEAVAVGAEPAEEDEEAPTRRPPDGAVGGPAPLPRRQAGVYEWH